jgi:hypothetical protein
MLVPAASQEVENVACPFFKVAVPSKIEPFQIFTSPVGMAPFIPSTVEVNITGLHTAAGLTDDFSMVAVLFFDAAAAVTLYVSEIGPAAA